jgi:hypothetical protein
MQTQQVYHEGKLRLELDVGVGTIVLLSSWEPELHCGRSFQGFEHVRRVQQEFEGSSTQGKVVPDMENGAMCLIWVSKCQD